VTGRQGMLTPPRKVIPPLVFPGVCVAMMFAVDCSISLNLTLNLTADFSVYPTTCTDFDCRVFCVLDLDTLILTTDFCVWNGHTADTTGRQGQLTHSKHLIPRQVYTGSVLGHLFF
jgi:hypothetical protein